MWRVEKHKKGWAVIHQEIGGYLHGVTTVIKVWPTKSQAEQHAATKPKGPNQ